MARTTEIDMETKGATSTKAGCEPCEFVWYELHTHDNATAAAFYEQILGWTTRDAGVPTGKYTLVCVGETPVGGLLEKPASGFASGEQARWMGYIGVDNAHLFQTVAEDSRARSVFSKRVQQAGGTVHRAAEEIPGVGTFAVVADPQGAIFTLFQLPTGITRAKQPMAVRLACPPGKIWELLTGNRISGFMLTSSGGRKLRRSTWVRMRFTRSLRWDLSRLEE